MTKQPSTNGSHQARGRDRSRPRRERGATLVEYSLIVAVVALGAIGAMDLLGAAAQAQFESAGEGISVTDGSGPTTPTAPTTIPDGGGGGGGGETTTTTTSTVPEADPGDQEDPEPTRSYSTWGPGSTQQKGNMWSAHAPIIITDDLGQRVEGATVTVRVEYRDSTGWRTATTQVQTTGSNGSLTFSSDDFVRSGKDPVTEIRFTVTSVDVEGLQHSPTVPSVTVKKP